MVLMPEGGNGAGGNVNGGLGRSHVHAAVARGELNGQLGAVLMHFIGQQFQTLGMGFVAQEVAGRMGVLIFVGHRVGRGINQAETALGTFHQIGPLGRRDTAVTVVNGAHRRHSQTILQSQIPQ